MIHPIIDEFYSHDPAHSRSAGFAQAKGQTITGPDKRVLSGEETAESGVSEGTQTGAADVVDGAIRRLRFEG
jgi:glutamine amidotransferase